MHAIASYFAPDPFKCYAGCVDKLNYQDLIVTKYNRIFCRRCLEPWVNTKQTCPMDRNELSPITDKNIRKKDEDPMIHQNHSLGMQYTSFKLFLERFVYSIQTDLPALENKLTAKNLKLISSCKELKEKTKSDSQEKVACSICLSSSRMYFILQDKDPARVGRFLHEECLKNIVDDKSRILDISTDDMVEVAKELPPPKEAPPSPATGFIVAIIPPVSFWALAMNTRIYHNKSFVLFVLSIPALIIFKLGSLLLKGLRAVFNAKPAY